MQSPQLPTVLRLVLIQAKLNARMTVSDRPAPTWLLILLSKHIPTSVICVVYLLCNASASRITANRSVAPPITTRRWLKGARAARENAAMYFSAQLVEFNILSQHRLKFQFCSKVQTVYPFGQHLRRWSVLEAKLVHGVRLSQRRELLQEISVPWHGGLQSREDSWWRMLSRLRWSVVQIQQFVQSIVMRIFSRLQVRQRRFPQLHRALGQGRVHNLYVCTKRRRLVSGADVFRGLSRCCQGSGSMLPTVWKYVQLLLFFWKLPKKIDRDRMMF